MSASGHRRDRRPRRLGTTRANRATRAPRATRAGAACVTLVALGTLAGVGTTGPQAHAAEVRIEPDPQLTIVEQPFVLAPEAPFLLSVQLPTDTDVAAAIADGTIVVTSHRPLTERTQVWDARDGSLPAVVDTIDVDIELDTGLGEPPAPVTTPTDGEVMERTPLDTGSGTGASARLSPTGLLTLVVPTETTRRTTEALQFAQAGVHPVVVEVRRNDRTDGTLITFVDRLTDDTTSSTDAHLDVGFVFRPDAAPTIERDGSITVDDDALRALAALADTLDALAEASSASSADSADSDTLPALVDLDPGTLAALADTDPSLATRLTSLLDRVTLTVAPRVPLDAATAAAAGQQLTYARLLDEGTALLAGIIDPAAMRPQITVVSSPLSIGGAELLEATGTGAVVMPYGLYSSLTGSLGLFTDTTRSLTVADTDLRLAVIDPFLAERLDQPGDDPEATAISIVAELLVLDRQVTAESTDTGRTGHGLVLARTDLGPIDADLIGRILTIATSTAGPGLMDPADLVAGLDTMQVDGSDVAVRVPTDVTPPAGIDPQARSALVDALQADTTAVSSMLAEGDPRITAWQQVTSALVSTVVDDDLAATMHRDVRLGHAEVRACVIAPQRFSFTLTGRTSTIPFSITNRCDVPITVRVRLDSPKIAFPEGDQLEVLQPGTDTEVRVRAEARTNGRSSVFLRLFTPAAVGADQQLGPDVVLTARVQSFAGLGQLLLGTFVLVVAAWWIRHWRDARRRTALEANAHRHPAAGTTH